jgi:syntaxin-binding protein 5
MAHLLRGKQAGIQGDFSAGITPELIALDDVLRELSAPSPTTSLSN